LLGRERLLLLGNTLTPCAEDSKDGTEFCWPSVPLEDGILHTAHQPIVAVHARPQLRLHERLIRHLRAIEVDAYNPSRVIQGLDLDARPVSPIAVAVPMIPLL
jgi:hypothetical protein